MSRKIEMTEYLELDVDNNRWNCRVCGADIASGSENYKKGCIVYARDPMEVHNKVMDDEYNLAPDPAWVRIIEFYCKVCGSMIETEYLPLGHPITHDMDVDVDSLRKRLDDGQQTVSAGKIG